MRKAVDLSIYLFIYIYIFLSIYISISISINLISLLVYISYLDRGCDFSFVTLQAAK